MPTQKYDNLEKAFQALTDLEIEDDKNNFPVATIRLRGVHRPVMITMVSEYDYFHVLIPLRDRILNYYANRLAQEIKQEEKDEVFIAKLSEKIKTFAEEMSQIKNQEDIEKKAKTMSYLFEDEAVRYTFFRALKKMKIIPFYLRWKRYQKIVRTIDTLTIFVFLWLFNFDGVKKNVKFLLDLTMQNMNSQLPIVSYSSENWDTYKKKLQEASQRTRGLSTN